MKKIVKDSSPIWFEDWKRNFKVVNGRDAHYKDDFSTDDTDGRSCRKNIYILSGWKDTCYSREKGIRYSSEIVDCLKSMI